MKSKGTTIEFHWLWVLVSKELKLNGGCWLKNEAVALAYNIRINIIQKNALCLILIK
jgi:hypothetical protein